MKSKILYLDDERENLEGFEFTFSSDFDIITTSNPSRALELLGEMEFKVVISDQRMPEMTGIEFLKKVNRKYPKVTRVILTAYADVEVAKDAINEGQVYRYLTKPYKAQDVHNALRNAIELYDLKNRNASLMDELMRSNENLTLTNKKLEESKEKYMNIFEGVSDGIIYSDKTGKVLEINEKACKIIGAKREDIVNKNATTLARKLLSKKSLMPVLNLVKDNIAGKRNNTLVFEYNGKILEVLSSNDKSKPGITGIIRDITKSKNAENALLESQERYKRLAEATFEGIAISDENGVVDVNKQVEDIYGYTKEEFMRTGMEKLVHPDDYEMVMVNIRNNYRQKYEHRGIKKDGSILYLEVQPDSISINGVSHRLTVIRDVTEQKLAQEELIESQERYQSLIESTEVVSWELDIASLSFTYVSSRVKELSGYQPEEWIGFDFWESILHPDEREWAVNFCNSQMADGNDHTFVYRIFTKDKKVKWVKDIVFLVKKEGKPNLLRGFFIDITTQKENEVRIRESEERYRALYENAPLAYQSLNKDGCFLDINPQWLNILGYKQEEVIGKYFGDFLHPEFVPHFKKNFKRFKKEGVVKGVEFEIRRSTGEYLRVAFEGCIGYDELGNVKQTYCTFKDITGEYLAKSALKSSEERYRGMFENMANGVAVYEPIEGGEDFRFLDFNPGAEKISNSKKEDVVGKTLLELFPNMDKYGLIGTLKRVHKTGKPEHLPPMFYKDNIRVGWRENFVYRLPDKKLVAMFYDVTERMMALNALKDSEEKYRQLFDNLTSGFALHEMIYHKNGKPKDYIFLDVNPAFEKLTGLKKNDIIGKTVLEVLPNTEKYWINIYGRVAKTGEPELFENYAREIDKYYEVLTYSPEKDYFATIFTDITKRKKSEIALRESEERYKALIDNSPNSVLVLMEGRYVFVNPTAAKMFGFNKPEELIGKTPLETIHPDDHEKIRERINNLKRGKDNELTEVKLLNKEGKVTIIESKSVNITINDKPAILIIGQDISLRVKHEKVRQAALRLNQMITEYSVEEIMREGLDFAEQITDSEIGYFHFVDPEQETISLQVWSGKTMKMCEVGERDMKYPIEKAGIWVECFYKKKPVVHNDYSSHPHKKGLPKGHVKMKRVLSVPVMENKKVVAVLGLGNKEIEYTKIDEELTGMIADNIWSVLRRKRMELDLKENELRYRTLSDMSTEGIMITKSMHVVDFNKALERITRYNGEELRGKSTFDFILPKYEDEIISRMQADYSPPIEIEIKIKGNKIIPVEIEGHNIIYNGEKHRATAVRDLSEKKHAQHKIIEAERRFRDLHRNVHMISVMLNSKGVVTFANDYLLNLTGWKKEEVIGENWFRKFIPKGEDVNKMFKSSIKTGDLPVHYENYILTRKGEKRLIAWTNTLLQNDIGDIIGTSSLGEDITEKREMEKRILNAQVEAEERERKRFAEDLHDELGPFLAGIKLYINEMSDENISPIEREEVADLLKRMVDESVEKTRTISNSLMPNVLMDYGMIKAINSFASRIGETRFINIHFYAYNWEARYENAIELVVYRIVIELINNTLKHANATNVKIEIVEEEEVLVVKYRDDGKGFNLEKELLKQKGLGVRNMISRIETINGNYKFTSEKNKGFMLEFLIPL